MAIGHAIGGAHNTGQGGDIADLLEHPIVHRVHEGVGGIDAGRHQHPRFVGDGEFPDSVADLDEGRWECHSVVLCGMQGVRQCSGPRPSTYDTRAREIIPSLAAGMIYRDNFPIIVARSVPVFPPPWCRIRDRAERPLEEASSRSTARPAAREQATAMPTTCERVRPCQGHTASPPDTVADPPCAHPVLLMDKLSRMARDTG